MWKFSIDLNGMFLWMKVSNLLEKKYSGSISEWTWLFIIILIIDWEKRDMKMERNPYFKL